MIGLATKSIHLRSWLYVSVATTALVSIPGVAEAAFVPPAGVSAYRLAFVTRDADDAESDGIDNYNEFVTAQAALAGDLPAATWKVIGSTAAVDARDNIACGAACDALPIYLVTGVKVADSSAQLFGGGIGQPIEADQFGTVLNFDDNYAWTGSNGDGTSDVGQTLGSDEVAYGCVDSSGRNFHFNCFQDASDINYRFYAISGSIESDVTPVPAPAMGAALLASGVIVTGIYRRRRDPQRA